MNVLLVFDARYRDFPSLLFAAPIAGYCFLATCSAQDSIGGRFGLEERILALWLIVSSVLIVALELPSNRAADLWCLLCLAMALSVDHFAVIRRILRLRTGQS
jgi:hypothetical protein